MPCCSRFLQGPGTDPKTVSQIRDAVKAGAELTVRILNYTKSGRAFWNMFTLAPMLDSDGQCRFYVGVQVDVTAAAQPGERPPAWTKSASTDNATAKVGHQAAGMISTALQGMGTGVNPWAHISGTVMQRKPHKSEDRAYQQLLKVQQQDGKLKLHHFRRVKQLGAGDVGLVDLVQLQVSGLRRGTRGGQGRPSVGLRICILLNGRLYAYRLHYSSVQCRHYRISAWVG